MERIVSKQAGATAPLAFATVTFAAIPAGEAV